jgi:hypothetical protein
LSNLKKLIFYCRNNGKVKGGIHCLHSSGKLLKIKNIRTLSKPGNRTVFFKYRNKVRGMEKKEREKEQERERQRE